MTRKILFTLLLILSFNPSSFANTDKLKDGANKILKGTISKIEVSVKGKKLKKFFENKTLDLLINGEIKNYSFKEKTYEVYTNGQLNESGKWKVSGLLKDHIKLKPQKSKAYFLKKISKKDKIYLYDKPPGSESLPKKETVEIKNLEKKDDPQKIASNEDKSKNETTEELVLKEEKTQKEKPKKTKKILKSLDGGKIAKSIDGIKENLFGVSSNKKNNNSNNEQTIQSHLLEKYKASSNVSYYFFEASVNYLQSLELLYRAYDKNVEADKISSSIDYLKNSKHSESNRLKSTKKIIGTSSLAIRTNIQDASFVLSEQGRTYWEQALPFALGAAQSTLNLYKSSKNTLNNVGAMGGFGNIDALLSNANDLGAAVTILPEIPQFTKNMFETVNLIFSAAKEKKIRDKGGYNKALEELQLEL